MEKFKYAKCEITYCSDEYAYMEMPKYTMLVFSESGVDKIRKHMNYVRNNDVSIRMAVNSETFFFEEDDDVIVSDPLSEDAGDRFMPSSEYIYIYSEGFYYKAYSESGQIYIESEFFEVKDLKDTTEWPEEI